MTEDRFLPRFSGGTLVFSWAPPVNPGMDVDVLDLDFPTAEDELDVVVDRAILIGGSPLLR